MRGRDEMEYKVNADFLINVSVLVEADSEEEAISKGKFEILNKNCEWEDPVDDPKINWAEKTEDDEPERQCFYCGQESCDCDML